MTKRGSTWQFACTHISQHSDFNEMGFDFDRDHFDKRVLRKDDETESSKSEGYLNITFNKMVVETDSPKGIAML